MSAAARLRPATAGDGGAIRRMIYAAQLNPTGLDWRRFVLAVDDADRILGCGQIKPHGDGSRELASIAVLPEAQGRGIARLVIEHLLETQPPPVYLMCRAELQPFYEKFGFRVLAEAEMPRYFRRVYVAFSRLQRLVKSAYGPLIMRRGAP